MTESETRGPISREQLFEQIWSKPMREVAASYGVSGSFLTRVCRRMNVPCPPTGHWARVAAGQTPAKRPLPPTDPWDDIAWIRGNEPPVALPLPQAPSPSNAGRRRRQGKRPTLHPIVAGARRQFDDLRNSHNEYLRPKSRRLPDVYVSKGTVDRALNVASSLYLALEDRGHRVMLEPSNRSYARPALDERLEGGKGRDHRSDYGLWTPDRTTVVFVGSVAIGLTVFEVSEKTKMRWGDHGYVRADTAPRPSSSRFGGLYDETIVKDMPSGKLCVRASSTYWRVKWEKFWPETKARQLAKRIKSIAREIEDAASLIVPMVAESERQAELEHQRWVAQRREEKRKALEKQRQDNLDASRQQLRAIIDAWGAAVRLDEFFRDAENRIGRLPVSERSQLLERLMLGRGLLGSTDPLEYFRTWILPSERPVNLPNHLQAYETDEV
jgi:hypothetical protein